MILITYLLAGFLILSLIAVIIVSVVMTKKNKELQAKNELLSRTLTDTEAKKATLQAKLDALMKEPSMLGISYKRNNAQIQQLAGNIKVILQEVQTASCPSIRDQFKLFNQQFVDSLKTGLEQNSLKCDSNKTTFNAQTTAYADAMTAQIIQQIPGANKDILKTQFKALAENILAIMCTGDTLDLAKVNKFLSDIIDAIC